MKPNRFVRIFSPLWFVLFVSFVVVDMATAGVPRVQRVTPPGGQRGTTVEVDFIGRAMDDPLGLLFYEPGLSVESIKPIESALDANGREQSVPLGTRLRVRLKIAADCPLGAHGLRLRTRGGLSEYQRFFVGPFPTIEETETRLQRNDQRDAAMMVKANSTIFGSLMEAADVDIYRIDVKRGQRLTAEIEAARLGVERGIPDLHLAIYDATGKKLAAADDSALFVQDPVLSIVTPRDGAYFIEVRHSMYNAQGDQYRLHVGTFVRPTGLYPAGGQAGSELSVQVLGDPLGTWTQTVNLPSTEGDFAFNAVDSAGVPAPSPNRLRVSPYPNVLETEPNDSPDTVSLSTTTDLPVAFNGIINKPGDVDCFRFRAKKGEQYRFHALAQALGSPCDPLIWIKPVSGRSSTMQRANDARPNQLGLAPANGLIRESHDAVLEFTVPADGEYLLGVEDERGEGGADYVYRIEVVPPQNAVYTYIAPEPENQFQPQARQSISVAPGNRTTVQVGIFSTNRPYSGELELAGVNLPEGVTIHAPKITPGMTRVPVVFEAAPDAKPQAQLVDLVVRPVGKKDSLVSGYRQTIAMNAYGNNDYYLHIPVSKLALAVTDPAPFRIEVEEPKSALVQNGEMTLKFKVIRAKGFNDRVTVQMEFRPPGINTATPATIRGSESEGTYLLGASRTATPGQYLVTLTAMTGGGRRGYRDGESRTYVASQPFRLTIAEPHIEARIGRTSIERGKTATLVCKLNHLQPIKGTAKATLTRLPRGIELVEPYREITAADKEVRFTLRATSEALTGSYGGITLDLTVTDNGQPVRQLTGYGTLRVDAERGASKSR